MKTFYPHGLAASSGARHPAREPRGLLSSLQVRDLGPTTFLDFFADACELRQHLAGKSGSRLLTKDGTKMGTVPFLPLVVLS